ncbi:type I-F CRISPR-associated helicase Cas3f [Stenotrophomonas mori]|uniref:Type I-F CRISPR-associated helicase Cas3f n=1 Tax=Stenotrophomonas mori TaxID=2871096 RepID=A0ABT0SLM1_9GAMM|nr:type I-F CRISPR-associated helicase Cas3f [Stenotrophomonas mori]MCL7715819.1 type I-F CRISPR-associated helicase Cas3f [Stenotrophomonas mori]
MNILLVSQCDKRALTETRRILDQFAERRGDRTWQTPITQAGLDTLRKLLRRTARKNTSVACHWIRGMDHSELLWIVGDARRFNDQGAVPTNTTTRDVLRKGDENTWHHLPCMKAITALAALLHDLGKATTAFQSMLDLASRGQFGASFPKTHYRHEWVSVRLFQAFVGNDDDASWLQRLIDAVERQDMDAWLAEWLADDRLQCDGMPLGSRTRLTSPFCSQRPLANAIAWLVLTHHRLPTLPVQRPRTSGDTGEETDHSDDPLRRYGAKAAPLNPDDLNALLERINADWNEPARDRTNADISSYWRFPHGLPVTNPAWRKQAARQAQTLLALPSAPASQPWLHDPFVMHVSRLCLMLADHYYSSLTFQQSAEANARHPVAERKPYLQPGGKLLANTARHNGKTQPNQTLDEHLLGVQANASHVMHALPALTRSLPALQRHRALNKRSSHDAFRWQDKAADLARSVRERSAEHGAFIVNMASTGCGKTLGNARIMNALADPSHGMRCAFAIGLRTLTQQTGRAFQRDLHLGDDELAILVGGGASRALFEHYQAKAEASGSASRQSLLEEDSHILYDGDDRHPLLQRLTGDARARRLIAAPVLACTVDHLTPATESLRGGRQIAPMLRLMTGDLVLDEPDDFDLADLPALTRLVHWAGLLGSRVLLSSATLPPALVQGLYEAYRDGRQHWQRNRGERPSEPPRITCLWIDEFKQAHADCTDVPAFQQAHDDFAKARCERLAKAPVRRIAELLPVATTAHDKEERRHEWAALLREAALQLHSNPQNHVVDSRSGKRVSFGLIRMANIDPLFDTALVLFKLGAPEGMRIHLCVYHSQHPLLIRSAIEHRLDTALDRRRKHSSDPDPVFAQPVVRRALDAHPEHDQLFIVLGSPVTEVGRDHDYDWAVVEPSSLRSLIQLAGRVRRHRPEPVTTPNVRVLDTNLRAIERRKPDEAAYCRPGFEQDGLPERRSDEDKARKPNFHLHSHRLGELLADLLDADQRWTLDARPRLRLPEGRPVNPTRRLVDLEHARLRHTMRADLPKVAGKPPRQGMTPWMINASTHWKGPQPWLTGVLPQTQRFRDDPMRRVDVVLLPDEDEEVLLLHRVVEGGRPGASLYVLMEESACTRLPDSAVHGPGIAPWGDDDLLTLLTDLAETRGESLRDCAQSFTTASLPHTERGWRFHPVLGFNKKF